MRMNAQAQVRMFASVVVFPGRVEIAVRHEDKYCRRLSRSSRKPEIISILFSAKTPAPHPCYHGAGHPPHNSIAAYPDPKCYRQVCRGSLRLPDAAPTWPDELQPPLRRGGNNFDHPATRKNRTPE